MFKYNIFNNRPILSVVVVSYNIKRELPRTLYSLSSKYQLNVNPNDYEVIIVDNGSEYEIQNKEISIFGKQFKYLKCNIPDPSPINAINFGIKISKGSYIGIMIDGARILSPGILNYSLLALQSIKNAFVYTMGWHLGPNIQSISMLNGYNALAEDKLLDSVNWKSHGYKLFKISTRAPNSRNGWFYKINESNCFFLSKKNYYKVGGYNKAFNKPGGGYGNHEFFHRVTTSGNIIPILLFGEGTFHQIHGGIATNSTMAELKKKIKEYMDQYKDITGYQNDNFKNIKQKKPILLGQFQKEIVNDLGFSVKKYIEIGI